MLCIPRSRHGLPFSCHQMVGSFVVAFDNSIRSFPLGCKLSFQEIFGNQIHFPHNSISDLELPGIHHLVVILGYPALVGCPCNLCFLPLLLQQV
jgi:hypothetical protein